MNTETQHETKERIFEAAAKLFGERSISAVSMREIAEQAGVSKPMLYYYFESKAGICRALIEAGIESACTAITAIADSQLPFEDRLVKLLLLRFKQIKKRPQLVKLFIDFLYGPDTIGLRKEYSDRAMEPLNMLRDLFIEAQTHGKIRNDMNPATLVGIFSGISNTFVADFVVNGTGNLDDELARQLVDSFMNGARARETESATVAN